MLDMRMANLISPDSTKILAPGRPCDSDKVHENGIMQNDYTINVCTKKKLDREINPEWGRNFKGFLYTHRMILS